jgi:hypothetical protein
LEYETGTVWSGVKFEAPVDHYGYYNSTLGQPNLIPITFYPGLGANREPSAMYAKIGALNKITYPTGGYTTFSYGPNMYFNGEDYEKIGHFKSKIIARPQNQPTGNITQADSFKLNYAQTISVAYSRVPKAIPGDDNVHDPVAEVTLTHWDPVEDIYTPIDYEGKIIFNSQNVGKTDHVELPAGTYFFNVTVDQAEDSVSAVINYKEITEIPIEGAIGSGIRVNTIVSSSGDGAPLIREFRYTNDDGFSTGHQALRPAYDVKAFTRVTWNEYGTIIDGQTQILNYSSALAQGGNIGLPHHYESVVEDVIGANGERLRTRYDYRSFETIFPKNFMSVEQTRVRMYKQVGNSFSVLKDTRHTYTEPVYPLSYKTVKPYLRTEHHIPNGLNNPPSGIYEYELGSVASMWNYLKSTRDVEYSGTDSLVSEIEYAYDVNGTKSLLATRTRNSDGSYSIDSVRYSDAYSASVTAVAPMQTKNIVNVPIETRRWQKRSSGDSTMIAGTITEYDPVVLKPSRIYQLEVLAGITPQSQPRSNGKYTVLLSDNRYVNKVRYFYDASARLISQQTPADTVSYIWGYTNPGLVGGFVPSTALYPIAEIRRATPAQFYVENFEGNAGNSATARTGSKGYSGTFTLTFNPTGRTYLVSWWQYSGGVWTLNGPQPYVPNQQLNGVIDDIRIYPKNSLLSTYTLRPGVGLQSVTDHNNISSFFEYDNMGRLRLVKDHNGDILKYNEYHYKSN